MAGTMFDDEVYVGRVAGKVQAYVDEVADELVLEVFGGAAAPGCYRMQWSAFLKRKMHRKMIERREAEWVKLLTEAAVKEKRNEQLAKEVDFARREKKLEDLEALVKARVEVLLDAQLEKLQKRERRMAAGTLRNREKEKELAAREAELKLWELDREKSAGVIRSLQWTLKEQRATYLELLQKKHPVMEVEGEALESLFTHEELDEAMEVAPLADRERLVVMMRFYEEASLEEIGKRIRVSGDRARQVLNIALRKMAKVMNRWNGSVAGRREI